MNDVEFSYEVTPESCQEAVSEMLTLRDMLRWTLTQFEKSDIFYGHGTDNAWDEALHLVLPCLDLPITTDKSLYASRLTQSERQAICEAVSLRVNDNIPVPYITNQAYFCEMPFYVDENVLIPRSPVGELIKNEFEGLLSAEPQQILDMCTGSACIAIACATIFPNASVDAVDISVEALEVAATNIDIYDLEDRVHLIHSDLFDALPVKQYDLIIANPPYVPDESMEFLPCEYSVEPELALRAGQDGLALALPIVKQAAQYLSPKGLLILEVGEAQEAFEAAFPNCPMTWLEFEEGGEGVCAILAKDLRALS